MVAGLVPIDRTKDITMLPIDCREQGPVGQDVINPRIGIGKFPVVSPMVARVIR